MFNELRTILSSSAIADYTSDPIEVDGNFAWSLHIIKNAIDTNPLVTIEHSNLKDSGYTPINLSSTDVELVDSSNVFERGMVSTHWMRFVIDKNAATTGDITVLLKLKGDN